MKEVGNEMFFLLFSLLALKITGAFVSSYYAQKLHRNKTLWWILGLLEFNTALLVLLCSDTLLISEKSQNSFINIVNNDYRAKLEELNNLYSEDILTENQLYKKRTEAYNEKVNKEKAILEKERSDLKNENDIIGSQKREKFMQDLKKALDDGHITTIEYEDRLQKLI